MSLFRLFCVLALVALFLPETPPPDGSAAARPADPPAADDSFVIRAAWQISHVCHDYRFVCDARDATVRVLHVQAVELTGRLHAWLEGSLEDGARPDPDSARRGDGRA